MVSTVAYISPNEDVSFRCELQFASKECNCMGRDGCFCWYYLNSAWTCDLSQTSISLGKHDLVRYILWDSNSSSLWPLSSVWCPVCEIDGLDLTAPRQGNNSESSCSSVAHFLVELAFVGVCEISGADNFIMGYVVAAFSLK